MFHCYHMGKTADWIKIFFLNECAQTRFEYIGWGIYRKIIKFRIFETNLTFAIYYNKKLSLHNKNVIEYWVLNWA
jgi:hypothetical protein